MAQPFLVQTNTQPFELPNAAIKEYIDLLHKTAPKVPVTSLGVQGMSAALLFATAAKELGSNLTRTGLLDELHKVHAWVGGGLHAGIAISWAGGRAIGHALGDPGAFDASELALGCAIVIATALVAAWLPARRAARLQPMEVLRGE